MKLFTGYEYFPNLPKHLARFADMYFKQKCNNDDDDDDKTLIYKAYK